MKNVGKVESVVMDGMGKTAARCLTLLLLAGACLAANAAMVFESDFAPSKWAADPGNDPDSSYSWIGLSGDTATALTIIGPAGLDDQGVSRTTGVGLIKPVSSQPSIWSFHWELTKKNLTDPTGYFYISSSPTPVLYTLTGTSGDLVDIPIPANTWLSFALDSTWAGPGKAPDTLTITPTIVPEPATVLGGGLVAGLFALELVRRRRGGVVVR